VKSVKLLVVDEFQVSSSNLGLGVSKILHVRVFSEKFADRFRPTTYYVTDTSILF